MIKISQHRMDMGDLPLRIGTNAPGPGKASGIHITLTAANPIALGDACCIHSSGQAKLARADAIENSSAAIVLAAGDIADSAPGYFVLHGVVQFNLSQNWKVGGIIYLSTMGTTGNTLTQTAPSGTNNVIQVLGVALAADTLYFNPQLVQVEHV